MHPWEIVEVITFQAKDRVVLFAAAEAIRKVEKMFSVRLEYF